MLRRRAVRLPVLYCARFVLPNLDEEIHETIFDVVDDCFDLFQFVCRYGGSQAFRRRWQYRQTTDNDTATGSQGACGSTCPDTGRRSRSSARPGTSTGG